MSGRPCPRAGTWVGVRCQTSGSMAAIFADPPVLCGHRGMGAGTVSGQAENTLESFLAAVDAGVDWVEVDARWSADDVLVARHDATLEDGRLVAALPADGPGALELLRVAELLDALPPHVGVDVEIKTSLEDALRDRDRTTAAQVAALLAAEMERRPVLVSSFDASALMIVRRLAPALPLGLLTWMRFPLRKAVPAAVHLGADVVLPHVSSFGIGSAPARLERPAAEHVAVAHDAGLQVAAWCPTPEQAVELVEMGVDCLIVDHASPRTWAGARALAR
jgi:glycerophosphoryl diester phosphodiesterase